MSRAVPRTVEEMLAWLRAHPEEPFFTLYSRERLLVGTRNDEGEIAAWECAVTAFDMDSDPKRRPARSGGRG